MLFAPDKIIIVIDINKIVKDIDGVIKRGEEFARPANNIRLKTNNSCTKAGYFRNCQSEGK